MSASEHYTFLHPYLFAFIRAMADRATRRPALRRVGVFMAKWFLGGMIFFGPLGGGEIYQVGFDTAWHDYRAWWAWVALGVTLLPVAFFLVMLAAEALVFGVILLLFLLRVFVGASRWDRVLAVLGRLLVLGFVLFLAIYIVGFGTEIARAPASVPDGAPPIIAAPSVVPSAPFSWGEWLRGHAFVLAIGGAIGSFFTKLAEAVFSEWFKKRVLREKKFVPQRVIPLYGADGNVVREIAVEPDREQLGL